MCLAEAVSRLDFLFCIWADLEMKFRSRICFSKKENPKKFSKNRNIFDWQVECRLWSREIKVSRLVSLGSDIDRHLLEKREVVSAFSKSWKIDSHLKLSFVRRQLFQVNTGSFSTQCDRMLAGKSDQIFCHQFKSSSVLVFPQSLHWYPRSMLADGVARIMFVYSFFPTT